MATLIRIENRERERSAMIKARKLQFTILIAEEKAERTEGSGGAEKGSHKASTDHRNGVNSDARFREYCQTKLIQDFSSRITREKVPSKITD